MMEAIREKMKLWVLCLFVTTILVTYCDARKSVLLSKSGNLKHFKILEVAKSLNMLVDVSMKDSSNPELYVSSPLSIPPYDSIAPQSFLPGNSLPQYCVYPPPNLQSPASDNPGPIGYGPTPPAISTSSPPTSISGSPNPPNIGFEPPVINPQPPEYIPSPVSNPPLYEPSPPSSNVPEPPESVPLSPIGFAPSPPIFEPPVVYPPPTTMSTPRSSGGSRGPGIWCVAKPSVPDPIIQEAMNYACGSGADCDPIQPNGQCFQPNTVLAHASYAFNSFWQRTKVAGGTCSFGGTAILVTIDPSSDGCRFLND